MTADGRTAVLGSSEGTVRVWDLATCEVRTVDRHHGQVNSVAVARNGRLAVSGSSDRTVRVWDLATGEPRVTFYADAPVTSCAISAEGRIIVAGDASGRVHLLRIEDGAIAPDKAVLFG